MQLSSIRPRDCREALSHSDSSEFLTFRDEIHKVAMDDPAPFLKQVVRRHDVLGVIVVDRLKGTVFPVFGLLAREDRHSDLDVGIVHLRAPQDEIAFEAADPSDADGASFALSVEVDDVLKAWAVVDPVVRVQGKIET